MTIFMTRAMKVAGVVLFLVSFADCKWKADDCKADADCPAGTYCYAKLGLCFQRAQEQTCEQTGCAASQDASLTITCKEGVCGSECSPGYEACAKGCCFVEIPCMSDAECTNPGFICNEKWGICAVASCEGRGDFTPCEVDTSPNDRFYDICVDRVCVSPGCGDASCNVRGPHFPLADTGQRKCYDNGKTREFSCPLDENAAFYGQDAQYGWDKTSGDKPRFARDASSATEPIIADVVTGLTWQGCVAGRSGSWCESGTSSGMSWWAALAYCETSQWAGYTNWRLPDVYELESIADMGRTEQPAIDINMFLATPSDAHWSSSSYAGNVNAAGIVYFSDGRTDSFGKASISDYVRCVRSKPASAPFLHLLRSTSASDEPVVQDNWTKLMWQGCTAGLFGEGCDKSEQGGSDIQVMRLGWEEGLAYCEGLDWGGYVDWRLPNIRELTSIVDEQRTDPAIDTDAFPDMFSVKLALGWYGWYQSSSSYVMSSASSWGYYSELGSVSSSMEGKGGQYCVRCVRGGLWDVP